MNDKFTELMEFVFRITNNRDPITFKSNSTTSLVHIDLKLVKKHESERVQSLDLLERLVMERLTMTDDVNMAICCNGQTEPDKEVVETRDMYYLYNCYGNLLALKAKDGKPFHYKKVKQLIIKLSSKATFKQEQSYNLLPLLMDNLEKPDQIIMFLKDITDYLKRNRFEIIDSFRIIFQKLHKDFSAATPLELPEVSLNILKNLSNVPSLVLAIIKYSSPKVCCANRNAYGNTLLGALLSISFTQRSLVTKSDGNSKSPDEEGYNYKFVKNNLWIGADLLSAKVSEIFTSFLKVKSTRAMTLTWIGKLLDYYGNYEISPTVKKVDVNFPKVIFSLNLSAIMVRVFVSFFDGMKDHTLLNIDPTYCAKEFQGIIKMRENGIVNNEYYMRKFNEMDCLLCVNDDEGRPVSEGKVMLITECFYMTHRAFEIATGFDFLLNELNELSRMVNTKYKLNSEYPLVNAPAAIARYKAMKNLVLEPSSVLLVGKFISATSTWLMQILFDPKKYERNHYLPFSFVKREFPVENPPATLTTIPRILLTNICRFCVMFKTADIQGIEHFDTQMFEPIVTMLITFIGSKDIVDNIRIRGELLESLASLLPYSQDEDNISHYYATDSLKVELFRCFQHPQRFLASLIRMVIDMEECNNLDIDDKFKYKFIVYDILEYVWKLQRYRAAMRNISKESQGYKGHTSPPLFIKFVYIIINDNVVLLDETMTESTWIPKGNGTTHRFFLEDIEDEFELATELDIELEYNDLSEELVISSCSNLSVACLSEAKDDSVDFLNRFLSSQFNFESQASLQVARILDMRLIEFGYVVNKKTIMTLKNLTAAIKGSFFETILVQKLAAMLYHMLWFILRQRKRAPHLDSLRQLEGVCSIYVSLGHSDEFCRCLAKDGRSYKPKMFKEAIRLLPKKLGWKLRSFTGKVKEMVKTEKSVDEILADAPDEYLDPITSEMFVDPVILPSGVTVDRPTIVRHIMANGGTDPFSRSFLSVEMLKPDVEMKRKITIWILEKRAASLIEETSY